MKEYDDEENIEENEEIESVAEIKELMREDKILNNSFNTGEMEYQPFTGVMKIDDRVSEQYRESWSDTIIEDRTIKMLEESLYNLFEESEYFKKYKSVKRVDKGDMTKMYYFFKEKLLLERKFSSVEIFVGFAEFFQINYDHLYNQIGVKDKEGLLKELHDKYFLTQKMKTKRLF